MSRVCSHARHINKQEQMRGQILIRLCALLQTTGGKDEFFFNIKQAIFYEENTFIKNIGKDA